MSTSETSQRYGKVAAAFTTRVEAVAPGAWENQSPCEKWVARDVVRHMVEVAGHFLGRTPAGVPEAPSVDDDPVGAWKAVRDAVQAGLDDPVIAGAEADTPMGPSTFEQTVGLFGVGDVLIHTWDLARATGLDERLDPEEVHRLLTAMQPMDARMRQGDAFGPKVEPGDEADEQARLIAFCGRQP